MCLPWNCAGFLPVLCLVSMPFYGSFFGTDILLRFSLMLCIFTVLTALLQKFSLNEPLVHLGLIAIMLATPVTFMPPFLLWFYDRFLHLSEPIWLLCEALGVLQLVRSLTNEAKAYMDEQPEKVQAVILFIAGSSYMMSGVVTYILMTSATTDIVKWSLLMSLALCLILHIIMWFATEGVLSDVAFITFCCVGAVYFIHHESHPSAEKIDPPESWKWIAKQSSVAQIIWSLSRVGVESTGRALDFLKQFLCPGFLVAAAARLYGVVISGSLLQQLLQKEWNEEIEYEDTNDDWENDSDIEENQNYSLPYWLVKPWRYSILTRLAVIFVYTQLVSHYMYNSMSKQERKHSMIFQFFEDLPVGRWSQIGLLAILYIYEMAKSQDDECGW